MALGTFTNLVTQAGNMPLDGSAEDSASSKPLIATRSVAWRIGPHGRRLLPRLARFPTQVRRAATNIRPWPRARQATPSRVPPASSRCVAPTKAPIGRRTPAPRQPCCNLYHRAVELVGRRWTGAILLVMMDGPLRFSEIRGAVPDLSDRLLSERLKELESEEIVERRVLDGAPVRVEYALTDKGRALEPTLRALKSWANEWLC